jgi:hypothetical protein
VIVDFVMQPHALSEVLEIQGETPAFDATSPSMSKTIPREEIENLPGFIGSDNLFTITPGVGEDHIAYGSPNNGNRHWLDGADITNNASGRPSVTPNYNWIEEVQVIGLGAPAEYGRFTGVVANSVTRSGSNQFHTIVVTITTSACVTMQMLHFLIMQATSFREITSSNSVCSLSVKTTALSAIYYRCRSCIPGRSKSN